MRSRQSSFSFRSRFKASRGVRAVTSIPSLCHIVSGSLERILIHFLGLKLQDTTNSLQSLKSHCVIVTLFHVPSSFSSVDVFSPLYTAGSSEEKPYESVRYPVDYISLD